MSLGRQSGRSSLRLDLAFGHSAGVASSANGRHNFTHLHERGGIATDKEEAGRWTDILYISRLCAPWPGPYVQVPTRIGWPSVPDDIEKGVRKERHALSRPASQPASQPYARCCALSAARSLYTSLDRLPDTSERTFFFFFLLVCTQDV